jgi:hypothetical protein
MNRLRTVARTAVLLLLMALAVSACSLTNNTTTTGSDQQTGPGAELGQIVTAEQIDPSTNAPVGEKTTFNSGQATIYAVVQAKQIDAGTSMFARWSRDGKPFEDSTPVQANQNYQDRYVEFHLQSTRQSIDPGNYTVQIFVNGNPASQATFTVQ